MLGASGYSGAELLRLLLAHPALSVSTTYAARTAGEDVATVLPHLAGATTAVIEPLEGASISADVCFSCLPHGVLPTVLDSIDAGLVIDLSDSFRADPSWVYGLVELNRSALTGATRVANPGCYPTASLLCLLPFVRCGAVGGPIVIDAMSGVSGAGRALEDRLLFSHLAGSVSAYGTTTHRHAAEIERGIAAFGGHSLGISFTPHLVPIPRGLLVTARAPLSRALDDEGALGVLHDAYDGEEFVTVLDTWPATKPVSGTNRAHLSVRVDDRAGMIICSAAIDNLGKGAAGQAIQNANVALGLEESTGLTALGVWP